MQPLGVLKRPRTPRFYGYLTNFLVCLCRRVQIHERQELEELLYKYGVDIFFSGYYHACMSQCEPSLSLSLSLSLSIPLSLSLSLSVFSLILCLSLFLSLSFSLSLSLSLSLSISLSHTHTHTHTHTHLHTCTHAHTTCLFKSLSLNPLSSIPFLWYIHLLRVR